MRRRWLPWRLRVRTPRHARRWRSYDGLDPVGEVAEVGLGVLDGLFSGWLTALVLLIVILTAVFLPIVVLVVEAVVLTLAAVMGLFARVALRRPWLVDAETRRERRTWAVIGWGKAARVADEVAAALERGQPDHVPHGAEFLELVREGLPPDLDGRRP